MRSPVASSNGDQTKSMCAEARYLIQWRPGQRLPHAAPRRGLEPKAGHNQALTLKTILDRLLLYSFFGVRGGIMVLSGGLTGKAFHQLFGLGVSVSTSSGSGVWVGRNTQRHTQRNTQTPDPTTERNTQTPNPDAQRKTQTPDPATQRNTPDTQRTT